MYVYCHPFGTQNSKEDNEGRSEEPWSTTRNTEMPDVKVFISRPQSADDKNLQVDLLCVRRLGGKSSIGGLLEGEREDGGDPGVARGTHLEFKLNV